jgi:hypothetical protein
LISNTNWAAIGHTIADVSVISFRTQQNGKAFLRKVMVVGQGGGYVVLPHELE